MHELTTQWGAQLLVFRLANFQKRVFIPLELSLIIFFLFFTSFTRYLSFSSLRLTCKDLAVRSGFFFLLKAKDILFYLYNNKKTKFFTWHLTAFNFPKTKMSKNWPKVMITFTLSILLFQFAWVIINYSHHTFHFT